MPVEVPHPKAVVTVVIVAAGGGSAEGVGGGVLAGGGGSGHATAGPSVVGDRRPSAHDQRDRFPPRVTAQPILLSGSQWILRSAAARSGSRLARERGDPVQ